MNLSYIPLQLQHILATPFASFVRQRTIKYASSQQLANGTLQNVFHLTERGIR